MGSHLTGREIVAIALITATAAVGMEAIWRNADMALTSAILTALAAAAGVFYGRATGGSDGGSTH